MLACNWDHPGVDRYTGTTEAAIHAYAEIPRATQEALIAKFERREFADFIVIDRDSISGARGNYANTIRSMHFGSNGGMCGDVTRDWAPGHTETAIVVCADGYCVADPAVCGNWFILGEFTPLRRASPQAFNLTPVGYLLATDDTDLPAMQIVPMATLATDDASGASFASTIGDGYQTPIYWPCCARPSAPVSPVPEPSAWLLLLCGFALIASALRRSAPARRTPGRSPED